MEKLWSDYADTIITQVSSNIKDKYNIDLVDLISDPSKFLNTPTINDKINNIKADINSSIDQIITSLGNAKNRLDDEMSVASSLSNKINQHITLHAKQNNVPLIKPYFFKVDEQQTETVYLDNADDITLEFVTKLISLSNAVMLSTIEYKDYTVGEWMFTTSTKNYSLRINIPVNPVYEVESARTEILDYLNSAKDYVGEEK